MIKDFDGKTLTLQGEATRADARILNYYITVRLHAETLHTSEIHGNGIPRLENFFSSF